jgi:hypothetical protein
MRSCSSSFDVDTREVSGLRHLRGAEGLEVRDEPSLGLVVPAAQDRLGDQDVTRPLDVSARMLLYTRWSRPRSLRPPGERCQGVGPRLLDAAGLTACPAQVTLRFLEEPGIR